MGPLSAMGAIKRRHMILPESAFRTVDWADVQPTAYYGEAGAALWRTAHMGDVRIRLVEYTPGYIADHWCERGHIVFVVEGELTTELRDGRAFHMTAGTSYHVSDLGDSAHRSISPKGAKIFIVD
jgi:hypothetical protein